MKRPWEEFARARLEKIFSEKKSIVDIGGSLRIDASKNNRRDPANDWLLPYLPHVDYKVLDKVADFNPDIVGDIHDLPFPDNSVDAVVCIAVLEHVEEPQKAVREIYRVLKPGGYCFLYAPFLFYYHPERGYYGDFYRFTNEGFAYMTRDFKTTEMAGVRGPLATAMNLMPFFSKRTAFLDWLDLWLRPHSRQVSGYNVFCVK